MLDDQGRYRLSPYGEVCKRLRDFTLAHPDIGVPLTPFAVVLDYHHGAYPGFGKRCAFWHFDYNAGDNMTWELINLLWPGGWEVMGRNEAVTMVNGPFGDIFDILLQSAPQKVLDSYPCLILSGDIRLSASEAARLTHYVEDGGTLVLNSAHLPVCSEFNRADIKNICLKTERTHTFKTVVEDIYIRKQLGRRIRQRRDKKDRRGHHVRQQLRHARIRGFGVDKENILAFSEGFANAFSAMVLQDPVYKDSGGPRQGDCLVCFSMESNAVSPAGWYNDGSIQSVLGPVRRGDRWLGCCRAWLPGAVRGACRSAPQRSGH